ncbi:MAG: DUF5702 domain-containing protein [Vallitalea sp.]|jgi:hypothetical protein|nr:DUF5702 domain-containing protein [Vallitalea sp.]
MHRNNTEGAITVFLSCILLIVIVFTCTIIDSTRIRVARLQAMRAIRSATNSILANYDSNIAREYGVFVLEKDEDDNIKDRIKLYANAALNPELDLPKINQIYQYIYPDNYDEFFNLYKYDIKITNITPIGALVENNTDYMQFEIIEYMKYRAPLLVIQPFLEKLQLITKSSSTTSYIKKKTEIINNASNIDDKYRELEKLIDGLNISKKGLLKYEDYFVKGILPYNKVKNNYLQEIPNKEIKKNLQNNLFDIRNNINKLYSYIDNFDTEKKYMVTTYKKLYSIRQEINSLSLKLSDVERQITILNMKSNSNKDNKQLIEDTLNELYKEQSQLSSSLANVIQDEEVTNKKFITHAINVKDMKNNIEKLITNINNLKIYLQKNQLAYDVIEEIEKESNKIKGEIDTLEKELENNKEDLIEKTCLSIENELDELKFKIAIPDGKRKYSLVNNLIAMKDSLKININMLQENIPHVTNIQHKKENILYHMLFNEFNKQELEILQAFISETNDSNNVKFKFPIGFINNFMKYNDNNYSKNLKESLHSIDDSIGNKYSTDNMIFDYGDMKSFSDSEKDKKDPRNEVINNTKNIEFTKENRDVTNKIKADIIPSLNYGENDSIQLVTDEKAEFENEINNNYTNKSLDIFSKIADKIQEETINIRNELYVNEYIIGNFKSALDNLPQSTGITLSNYSKKDHYMNNEVEYILNGSFNEKTNMNHVTNTIIGIRFVMNYIHILTNSVKRNSVMAIATSMAGWWTFGLGTYIVAALIMAAWSYAESFVDVKYLLQGKRVAFLKTSGDWYTSLEGIFNNVVDETGSYITNKLSETINKIANETKEKVNHITNRFTKEVSSYSQQKINEIIEDTSRSLNYAIDEIDNTINEVINSSFDYIRQGANKPNSTDYNMVDNDLISNIINTICNDYREAILKASYSKLIIIKKDILKKYNNKIESMKNKLINNVVNNIEYTSNAFQKEIDTIITNTSTKYKDITKKQIINITQNVKETINKQVSTSIDIELGKQGKGNKIKSLTPSFTYNDYLRLMLLIGVDDDTKLYRTLDLIQFNLQKNRNDDDLILKNYKYGYSVTAKVSVNYLFFKLPFMPDRAKDIGNNSYTFTVKTDMVY